MKGNIYCIYHNNTICYVGSTIRTLNGRLSEYRSKHNNPSSKEYNYKINRMMREYGFSNFEISLLETVEVVDRRELFSREGGWMDTFEDLGIELYNTQKAQGLGNGPSEESYQKQLARQREKIPCPLCWKMINRNNIRDHQRQSNCI